MKTLSQLIKEAEERFDEKAKYVWYTKDPVYGQENERDRNNFKVFFSKELTNIVKESFKNTRVEELNETGINIIDGETVTIPLNIGYNSALSELKDIQNQFLNN